MEGTRLDTQLCRQCRGRCCQGHSGVWSEPQRFHRQQYPCSKKAGAAASLSRDRITRPWRHSHPGAAEHRAGLYRADRKWLQLFNHRPPLPMPGPDPKTGNPTGRSNSLLHAHAIRLRDRSRQLAPATKLIARSKGSSGDKKLNTCALNPVKKTNTCQFRQNTP